MLEASKQVMAVLPTGKLVGQSARLRATTNIPAGRGSRSLASRTYETGRDMPRRVNRKTA
jgi:hypothetical protein